MRDYKELSFYTIFNWLVGVEKKDPAILSTDIQELKRSFPAEIFRLRNYLKEAKCFK